MRNKKCAILMRMVVISAAAVFFIPGAGSANAGCPPRYEIAAIVDGPSCPFDQTASVEPAGLNDHGQFVGSFTCPAGFDQPMLWDDGVFTALTLPDGFFRGRSMDINTHGVICGWISDPTTPFICANGQITELPIPPETAGAMANAISDTGRIVGTTNAPYSPVIWEDGEFTLISVPIGPNALGADISSDGRFIVGWMGDSPGFGSRVFVWEEGEVTDLGTLFGGDDAWAEAVNNRGSVVGTAITPLGDNGEFQYHAFLWREGSAIDLGTVAGFDRSYGRDVNGSDIVVGQSRSSTSYIRHAFVWRDGVMWDLNDLVPHVPDLLLRDSMAINEEGQVLAQGQVVNHSVAVFLTPADPLIGDLDCDGEVGIIDLLDLLGQWGPCSPPPAECPADLRPDGLVDVVDLLLLLANWG